MNGISFFNYTAGWKPFGHERSTARIEYLSQRRNLAVKEALESNPQTDEILMIDSYYLQQRDPLQQLVDEYRRLRVSSFQSGCILGASNWIFDKTRVRTRNRFFDNWTTPEAANLNLEEAVAKGGVISVKGVGGCYLYPRFVWEKVGYGVPRDLHGCEHNWLCERSGLRVLLSLNERLWREPIVYSWPKRIRMSLNLRRVFPPMHKTS